MSTKLAVCLLGSVALLLLGVGCAAPVGPNPALEAPEVISAAVATLVTSGVQATLQAQSMPSPEPTAVSPTAVPTPTVPCRLWLSATEDTPLREGPGDSRAETGRMLAGQSAEIIGRDTFYSWWVVVVDGRAGWVSGRAVALSDCANYPPALALALPAGTAPRSVA